jgi:hypothetical protein
VCCCSRCPHRHVCGALRTHKQQSCLSWLPRCAYNHSSLSNISHPTNPTSATNPSHLAVLTIMVLILLHYQLNPLHAGVCARDIRSHTPRCHRASHRRGIDRCNLLRKDSMKQNELHIC